MCSSFSNKMTFLQHSNFAFTKDDSGIQSDEASPHYANELQTGPKLDDVIGGLRSAANLAKQDPANHPPPYNCVCTGASIGYEQIVNTGLHSAVNFILTVIHSGVPRPVLTVLL